MMETTYQSRTIELLPPNIQVVAVHGSPKTKTPRCRSMQQGAFIKYQVSAQERTRTSTAVKATSS